MRIGSTYVDNFMNQKTTANKNANQQILNWRVVCNMPGRKPAHNEYSIECYINSEQCIWQPFRPPLSSRARSRQSILSWKCVRSRHGRAKSLRRPLRPPPNFATSVKQEAGAFDMKFFECTIFRQPRKFHGIFLYLFFASFSWCVRVLIFAHSAAFGFKWNNFSTHNFSNFVEIFRLSWENNAADLFVPVILTPLLLPIPVNAYILCIF